MFKDAFESTRRNCAPNETNSGCAKISPRRGGVAARSDGEISEIEAAREDFVGLKKFVGDGHGVLL